MDIYTWIQRTGKFMMVESFEEVAGRSGFVYAPFHRRTDFPVVFFEPETVILNDKFDDSFSEKIQESDSIYPEYEINVPVQVSKKEYLSQANAFIQSFNHQFTKAVLSRVEIIEKPSAFDAGGFFLTLQKNYPEAFCHLIHIPGNGTWTGATPETLLRMNKQTARTMALAGTKR